MEQSFIAREEQLKQLHDCLAQAVNGQGRVSFVSGEAGSGKTTLVQEFIRQAQAQDKDLAVAVGLCDAQTGVGDAYLPFREVLGQLTGDVDAKLAQGVITSENAGRLKNMLVLAGQAIVDVGPDLIGVFVPGVGLVTKLGAFVAEKVGWLDKLEKLVNKPKAKPGESGIQDSHIFEQYANVLCRISEKNPLLIILDDLHWGDAASINLLFHLGRRIGRHRILILGTYRSAEVAIGRGKERHPLEKVLAEFKRYFGDITIDLDKAVEEEGRQFVEAFLESEPNKLKNDFITNLYHHTGGHPLFTVELLRNMQERGDLVKDDAGRWIESESLNWEDLPTKVEGVIEERIGRLEQALKHLLTVGSVQGENFTAEVVARVQQAEAGGLIRKLSGELERQHRLVHSEGIRRLDPGGQRLSLFRFQHNLFRTYLYNELSEAERAYLHEDVGNALETLYGDQADEVAVQLALHFEKAGVDEKAGHYLQKAGEQSAARYANEEAIHYFTKALEITPQSNHEQRFDLLMLREDLNSICGNREGQIKDLELASKLILAMDDGVKRLNFVLKKAGYFEQTGKYQEALDLLEEAKLNATSQHDLPQKASIHKAIGFIYWKKGSFTEALKESEIALEMARQAGLTKLEAGVLHDLAVIQWRMGSVDKAREMAEQSLIISRSLSDTRGESLAYSILGNIELSKHHHQEAREYYQKMLQSETKIGDVRGQGMAQGNLGIIAEIECDHSTAIEIFKNVRDIFQRMDDLASEARAWAHIGLDYSLQGLFVEASLNLEKAMIIFRKIDGKQGLQWVLGLLSRVSFDNGQITQSEKYCLEALEIAQNAGIKYYEKFSWWMLGRVHLAQGKIDKAESDFQKAKNDASEEKKNNSVQASLAEIELMRGNFENALSFVNEILVEGTDLPFETDNKDRLEILLLCYKVLAANNDGRAKVVLDSAHKLLFEQVEHIDDLSIRQALLENVPANREILAAYRQQG